MKLERGTVRAVYAVLYVLFRLNILNRQRLDDAARLLIRDDVEEEMLEHWLSVECAKVRGQELGK